MATKIKVRKNKFFFKPTVAETKWLKARGFEWTTNSKSLDKINDSLRPTNLGVICEIVAPTK